MSIFVRAMRLRNTYARIGKMCITRTHATKMITGIGIAGFGMTTNIGTNMNVSLNMSMNTSTNTETNNTICTNEMKNFKGSIKEWENLIEKNYTIFFEVPVPFVTYKMCDSVTDQNVDMIEHIPINMRDYKICKKVFKKGKEHLVKHVPIEYCVIIVRNDPNLLEFVPEKMMMMKQNMVVRAVEENPNLLRVVPTCVMEVKQDMVEKAVEVNPDLLSVIPSHIQTQKMVDIAVERNPRLVRHVDYRLKTYRMKILELKLNGNIFPFLPKILQTKRTFDIAMSSENFTEFNISGKQFNDFFPDKLFVRSTNNQNPHEFAAIFIAPGSSTTQWESTSREIIKIPNYATVTIRPNSFVTSSYIFANQQ